MGDADKVDAVVGHVQLEVAMRVGFGARGFLHALGETDENDIVASRDFVCRLVGNGAGDGCGGEGCRGVQQEQDRKKTFHSGLVQFSMRRSGTRRNSRSLLVMSMKLKASA